MTNKKMDNPNTSPLSDNPPVRDDPRVYQPDGRPPRKPDWLLILVSILFLITMLIAWLADIPSLFR